jgi:SSS family solute:Na+ symporter
MSLSSQFIQYGIIAVYFAFIVIKGLLHSRKITNQDDFLLAGRNIGWFFLLCTMSATVIGGGSSIGAIGKTYEWGLLMVFVSTGWYLQFIFSGLFIAPRFRELKLYTVAGFFAHRYDNKNRFIALLLSLIFSIGILSAQMVAFGKIITSMISEIPYLWAVIIGGCIVILYSTAGGLMAVIHTDVYQFLILFAGFIITLILCIPDLISFKTEIISSLPSDFFKVEGGKGIFFALSTFFAFLVGETFAPGYATRFCVGKNIKETKKGIVGAGLFLTLTFPVILFIIAMYARFYFPDIDSEQALPKTILKLNSPLVGGLIIAALMSAVMSSADSILNSSTAIIVKDIAEVYFKNINQPYRKLRIARIFSILIGISGMGIALLIPNIIDLLLLTYTLWAPGILIPVIVGVLIKTKSRQHNNLIFICMLVSMISTLVLIFAKPQYIKYPAVWGVAVSLLVYLCGRFILRFIRK